MIYIYEAVDKKGVSEKGELESSSKDRVVEYLEKRNLIPVLIQEKGVVEKKILSISFFDTIKPIDRILFVRNLAATVRAGLNIIESLDILIADTANKKMMNRVLVQAKNNLKNGQPLSATFESFRKFFPLIFVGMLKAGEMSGNLGKTLDELARHLTREYNLSKKIKSALAYPIILLVASIGIVILLLVFVMPRLIKTFKQSGVQLPFITRFIIGLSGIFTYSPALDIIAIVFIIWFFTSFRKTALGQRLFLWMAFRIPVVRELVKKVALVRFTRSLGSLVASGTSIVESMDLAANSAGNEYYKKAITDSIAQIKNGVPLSQALDRHPNLFPKFLTSLVTVGERTGTLENILKTFSDFYDDEIDEALKSLTTFLEPILLLVMGIVVGSIALSILIPIYSLVSKF